VQILGPSKQWPIAYFTNWLKSAIEVSYQILVFGRTERPKTTETQSLANLGDCRSTCAKNTLVGRRYHDLLGAEEKGCE